MEAIVWFFVGAASAGMGAVGGGMWNPWLGWAFSLVIGCFVTAIFPRLSVLAGAATISATMGAIAAPGEGLAALIALVSLGLVGWAMIGFAGFGRGATRMRGAAPRPVPRSPAAAQREKERTPRPGPLPQGERESNKRSALHPGPRSPATAQGERERVPHPQKERAQPAAQPEGPSSPARLSLRELEECLTLAELDTSQFRERLRVLTPEQREQIRIALRSRAQTATSETGNPKA